VIIVQGILWHMVFSTLCGALLALVFQGLNGWIAAASLLTGAGLVYACRAFLPGSERRETIAWDWIDKAVAAFILLLGLRHFAYLYFSVDNAVQTLLKNNYGDLPLHIAYIRHLTDGAFFPPDNPFFSLENLFYPFGVDFYNAFWEQLGVPTQTHLFGVGFLLLLATLLALYRFGGILVVGAFFLNGGWAGWQLLTSGAWQDYQETLTWKNFFMTLFITQRGLLMALPLGLWLIGQVRQRFYVTGEAAAPWSRGQILLVGLAWGALPFFHMHAFIVVSLLIAFYTLAGPAPKSNVRQLAPVLALAVPLGTVFVLYLTDLFRKGSMLHFQWSWFAPRNMALFFGVELGPWTLFLLAAAVYRLWKGSGRERAEWLMAGGAFLLFNAVLLAPWEWDKLKVLIWFYLIGVALAAKAVTPYLTLRRKAVLCLVLFFSGTVSLLTVSGGRVQPTKLYEWRELWNTKGAALALPKDAVVAATPTFNHPLSFWGYAIAVGYSGHLWSHGIDYQEPEAMIGRIYQGGGDWRRIAAQLRVTHIFWGPMEKERYGQTPPAWRAELTNLSPVPGYELYAVGPGPTPEFTDGR
jgi:hypothetical protein